MIHPLADEARVVASFLVDVTPIEKLPRVDAIFAFGHSLSATPEHAAQLYHRGLAPWVVVTGHSGLRVPIMTSLPPGFATQADFFASVLTKAGVPDSAIITEKESRHTFDNVVFGMREARKSNLTPQSLILCALPWHLRRCRATFAQQFPAVVTYGSSFIWDEAESLTDYRIGRLVGEVDRLIRYAQKGDTALVVIPAAVANACQTIRGKLTVI